jgi:hypothetical protein
VSEKAIRTDLVCRTKTPIYLLGDMPNILLHACIVAFKGEYDVDHPKIDPRDTTLITSCIDSGIFRDLLDLTRQ